LVAHIVKSIASISEKIGAINANYLNKPSPKLRNENKIKTIHSSLKIEGNTTEEQITALLENKGIIGPKKDVKEVLNAIEIDEHLENYNSFNENSFLKCHKDLMNGLIEDAGKYRKQSVRIMKGSEVEHFAPSHQNVSFLITSIRKF
jgi:Fic family protein